MKKNFVIKILLSFLILILVFFIYSKFNKKKEITKNDNINSEVVETNSNIINDVNYSSKDATGNEYNLFASNGQIDNTNSKLIFLTDLEAIIKLNNGNKVEIKSDFGKYNINNFDTIFSKNVIIIYENNKITGDYVDFSLDRSSLIISKNVIYTNLENTLKADVVEINIKTKDAKIYMHEKEKKINIKSFN